MTDFNLRLLHYAGNLLLVGLETSNEVLLKRAHAISQDAGAVQVRADHQGLVDVKLKLAVHATDAHGDVVAHDLGTHHGQGLALRGVDLAGHDGASGLVLRQDELTETAAGPASEVADILGNLGERGRQGVQASVGLDKGVVGGEGLELVGGSVELGTGNLGDLLSNSLSEANKGVDTGADGSTTLSKVAQVAERALNTLDALVELSDISGELLAKGEGSGVLQVSAANLDDVLGLKLVDLLLESIAEAADGGDQLVLSLEDSSNVHDGGESVVGRGAAVDVVVGVDGLLGALLAAEDLNGTVGDDLVGVHVGLGARARLPDDQREVVHELAIGDLLGGLLDGLGDLGVKAEALVDNGSGALENTKGLDNGRRHAVLGLVDAEVLEGSLGLGAPVLVGGDLDLAKGVALGSGVGSHVDCG